MTQISHATLQFLKQILQDGITDHTYALRDIKQEEGRLWSECDPDVDESSIEFDRLNALRNEKRWVNRRLDRMIEAQTEIKRAIAAGN